MSSTVQDAPLLALPAGYGAKDPDRVRRYLSRHPHLVPLLHDARRRIQECFGRAGVALDVVTDRDCHDLRQLIGYIVTPLAAAEGWARLERFDEAWVLPHVSEIKGLLNFDVEFQPDTAELPLA